jgi:Ni/Co efflux regulator RcnB/surface antigen
MMKILLASLLAVSLLSGTAAMAQPAQSQDRGQSDKRDKRDKQKPDNRKPKGQQQTSRQPPATQQRTAQQPRTVQQRTVQQRTPAPSPTTPQRTAQQRAAQQRTPAPPPTTQQRTAQQRAAQQRAIAERQRYSRGNRLPQQYRESPYAVNNWREYGLQPPPYGYRWYRDDRNNFFLVVISTGLIAAPVLWEDRDRRWRDSYRRTYNYDDDYYYRRCRAEPDPAGIIAGAIIGALLGNTVRERDRAEATIAGIIIGGTLGAALTSHMDCDDMSYAYRTYSDGFNDGRIDYDYRWRNPRSGHGGTFRITRYYYDRHGFRCAEFFQRLDYLRFNDRDRRGRACLQPDGAWVIVG